jgi:hypothetical protein
MVLATIRMDLVCCNGLYYCPMDVFAVDKSLICQPALHRWHLPADPLIDQPPFVHFLVPDPKMTATPLVNRLTSPVLPNTVCRPSCLAPTSKSKQVEPEVWLLCLGSPSIHQLNVLPGNVTGLPLVFEYHPFRFIDFKEQARIRKQAAQRLAVRTTDRRRRFYMDFRFMRTSTSDYSCPTKGKHRVV